MPFKDCRGRMDSGSMTSRIAGYCTPGEDTWGKNSRGREGARRRRHRFATTGLPGWARLWRSTPRLKVPLAPCTTSVWPEVSETMNLETLKAQASRLEETLEILRRRIQKLENEAKLR